MTESKETIELMRVFKKEGNISCNFSRDCMDYELYGFLKFLVKDMEQKMQLAETHGDRYFND